MYFFIEEKKFNRLVNIIILFIHLSILVLFSVMRVDVLVYYNMFSVLLYLVCFFIIKRYGFDLYMSIAYIEIWLHMILVIYFAGWRFGFQIYCFALLPVFFYQGYLIYQRKGTKTLIKPIVNGIISMAIYLSGRSYSQNHEAIYDTSRFAPVVDAVFLANCGFAFLFLIMFMWQFVNKTMQYDEQLQQLAWLDRLTGIHNRYYMDSAIDKLQLEDSNKKYWIAIMDVDDFKMINDNYGHNCGDYILSETAKLMEQFEDRYIFCRWGGEEFLFLGEENSGAPNGMEIIDTLRTEIMNYHYHYNGKKMSITATFGITYYQNGETIDTWISRADNNLYQGKRQGKNCVKM